MSTKGVAISQAVFVPVLVVVAWNCEDLRLFTLISLAVIALINVAVA